MSKLTREGFRAMHEQAAEALERSRSSLNVLICAGTGCIASGSMKVYEELRWECESRALPVYVGLAHHGDEEKSFHVKMSGCHGFCEMGPLVHIEPMGVMYIHVKPEDCHEIVEKTLLGGEIIGEESYTLPTAGERKLIRIRKTAPTPQKYPRRSDKIKKQPLG